MLISVAYKPVFCYSNICTFKFNSKERMYYELCGENMQLLRRRKSGKDPH